METFARPLYSGRVRRLTGRGLIVVLTGQRRVGKSCLLRQIAAETAAANPAANIIYITKEKKRFDSIRNDDDLSRYVDTHLKAGADNYLLIDEVQEIEHFERALRSLNADEECQIIVTGSNDGLLASGLASTLGGRCIYVHVYGLSYGEFLAFHSLRDSDDSLQLYLRHGGMPHLHRLGLDDRDLVWDYMQKIYDTVALKDINHREGVDDLTLFADLMAYASDHTGQLLSPSSLSKYLTSQQIDLDPQAVARHLKAACRAYLVDKVGRGDPHGKRMAESSDKYYFEDLGLRNLMSDTVQAADAGKIMENAAYLHLKGLGYKVSAGTQPLGDVDFIAEKDGKTVYVQVSDTTGDDRAMEREFGNLLKIRDNHPKYLVTMHPVTSGPPYAGIHHMTLRQFLLTDNL